MLKERIITRSTLNEATNGVIPQKLSAASGKAFQISCYLGFSFLVDNEVIATSVLALKTESAPPLIDRFKTYVAFTSIAIKRLLSEEKLRESEQKLKTVSENMTDIVMFTDHESRYHKRWLDPAVK